MTKMADDKDRPPIEHTAWVFSKLCDHLQEGGSFRYLIYNRMGYGPDAYIPLYIAGGMTITNSFSRLEELLEEKEKDFTEWAELNREEFMELVNNHGRLQAEGIMQEEIRGLLKENENDS